MTVKNQKGLTLVEMLAVIVILTISFSVVYYIITTAIKQQSVQTKEVEQIQNGSYLLKQITKDLRKSLSFSVPEDTEETEDSEENVDVYNFLGQNDEEQYKYEYYSDTLELYRTDLIKGSPKTLIGRNVKDFSITTDENDSSKIKIYFTLNGEVFKTEINFRKGG